MRKHQPMLALLAFLTALVRLAIIIAENVWPKH